MVGNYEPLNRTMLGVKTAEVTSGWIILDGSEAGTRLRRLNQLTIA
jgi:hypothetical protein